MVPEHGGPLFGFQSLYRAWRDCRHGKGDSPARWRFEADLERNLFQLADELSARRYQPSPSVCFVSNQPKRREIFAAHFRDRVVHHLLVRHLEPIFERRFIHDSYACRRGKGTLAAVDRVQQFIRQVSANGSRRAWCLHLDVRSFFVRIDKAVLLRHAEGVINRSLALHGDDLCWLLRQIVLRDPSVDAHRIGHGFSAVPAHKSLYNTQNRTGLPIGNYSSQFLANVYLDPLDQFIKHTLKAKHYVRYVDDLLLMHPDRSRLEHWEVEIDRFLRERLALELNPGARVLAPVTNGIDALGYVVHKDHRLLRRRTVRRWEASLSQARRQIVDSFRGVPVIRMPNSKAIARLLARCASYEGLLRHADAHMLLERIEARHAWLRLLWVRERPGHLRRRADPRGCHADLRSQWLKFRRLFPKCLIWMRLGRFWECFEGDARKWSLATGLPLLNSPRPGFKHHVGFPNPPRLGALARLSQAGIASVLLEQGQGYAGALRRRSAWLLVGLEPDPSARWSLALATGKRSKIRIAPSYSSQT